MKSTNNKFRFRLMLLLPLLISMGFVGFYNISNANQNKNIQLNQNGITNSLFPVMGYASITANGQSLSGFVSVDQMAGVDLSTDFIEFFTYRHEISTPISDGSRLGAGRIAASPIIITKRIDQTTPLLAQALIQNQLTEGYFLFFDVDPDSGATFEAFKVSFTEGRVSSLRTFTVVGNEGSQLVEEVSFIYNEITWEDIQNSVEFAYSRTGDS